MSKIIELTDTEIIIKDGENISAIRIDENNPSYIQLKEETNNFTENMVQKTQTEILEQNQADLIYQLMFNGVV